MPSLLDETGQRYGRLTVAKRAENNRHGQVCWLCRCDCGREKVIWGADLRRGTTHSCGCLQKEKARQVGKENRKHGLASLPAYHAWHDIIQRCTNPNDPGWCNYGGRGITICERWQGPEGLANFIQDMGPRPAGHTLERIDNDGNYEPGNCRWATQKEQMRNTRQNHNLTFQGRIQCITAWAEELDIKPYILFSRIRYGWSVERALTQPIQKHRKVA